MKGACYVIRVFVLVGRQFACFDCALFLFIILILGYGKSESGIPAFFSEKFNIDDAKGTLLNIHDVFQPRSSRRFMEDKIE